MRKKNKKKLKAALTVNAYGLESPIGGYHPLNKETAIPP